MYSLNQQILIGYTNIGVQHGAKVIFTAVWITRKLFQISFIFSLERKLNNKMLYKLLQDNG